MQLSEQLRLLESAQGHPAKLVLAAVELAYPSQPDVDREALKEALEADAVPHWCDERMLSALLDLSPDEASARLARLRVLTVVERFPARGPAAVNVHEAARLTLRKHLAEAAPERFRTLSARAALYLADDLTPASRIEWIFHLLIGNPECGADELEKLNRDWSSRARPEDFYALANALKELEDNKLVGGRARVWVLLVIAWVRVSRGESAQLLEAAKSALQLACVASDQAAKAEAQCLLGVVLQAQGQLEAAHAAFAEYLAISRRLAEQDSSNTGWQRELSLSHNNIGNVLPPTITSATCCKPGAI